MVISIREVRLVPLSFPLVDTHEAFSDLQVAKEISIPTRNAEKILNMNRFKCRLWSVDI